ncbi:MAG TPA: hypothetical protein VME40_20465 [Caulobacteraceae bacterium]|nr:hypothetical protein [Caulobacteraceae bacterium]
MRPATILIAVALGGATSTARAGEARCWRDNGAVVVAAALGDIAGDFILDLSAPRSQLHLTVAQAFGVETPSKDATLRLAGEAIPASFVVTDLDARGAGFPTSIAGVIGEDALAGYVVRLQLSPCRLTLGRARAGLPRASQVLRLKTVAGVPAVTATISDGRSSQEGLFAIDTSSWGVKISDAIAAFPPGVKPQTAARIAGVEFGGDLISRAPASLEPQTPGGLVGALGDVVWSRYAWIRLDVRAGRLELGPAVR